MGRKYCSKCGKKVPRTYKTRNGKVKKTNKKRKYCFNCSPIQTKHKQDHPQIRFSKNNTEKRRRKQILVDMLGGKCENCGYKKSLRALSFHHVNPPQKKFEVSNGNILKKWDAVLKEAKKCVILCLNCHAEFHNDNPKKTV